MSKPAMVCMNFVRTSALFCGVSGSAGRKQLDQQNNALMKSIQGPLETRQQGFMCPADDCCHWEHMPATLCSWVSCPRPRFSPVCALNKHFEKLTCGVIMIRFSASGEQQVICSKPHTACIDFQRHLEKLSEFIDGTNMHKTP